MLACDYSFARPDPHALWAAGYVAVYRYLAPLPNPKVVTASERDVLHAAGFAIGFVWEGGGQAALGGHSQGVADAYEANRQADLLGVPLTVNVFYAVDFQPTAAQMAAVSSYYAGCTSGRRPARLYGPRPVLDALKVGGWQAAGWNPGGGISPYASVVQRITPTVWSTPNQIDEDAIVGNDHGLWFPNPLNPTTKPPPVPVPVPVPTPQPGDNVDQLLLINDGTPGGATFLFDAAAGRCWNLTGAGATVATLIKAGVKQGEPAHDVAIFAAVVNG